MNPETFFDSFGLLADTPNGVQKLRELILQLAVQGKLVPQDPNDGHAAEKLLKQANKEKNSFVKEFRVRKPVSSLPINDEEKPHELPHGWEWCRNSDLFALRKGKKPKNLSESEIGLPYLDIAALDRNVINRFTDDMSCPMAKEEDLIIVCDGSRSGLVLTGKNGVLGSTLAVIHNFVINKDYLRVLLLHFYNEMNSNKKGAAIPHLDIAKMYSQIIGLPPLNEQRRIIAKVDQLMTLCDELEARQQKKQETRLHLNSAALDKLLTAHKPDEFAHHWQRICDNFDLLYGAPETVGELRKTILQLAVQGKLVRQDPNDEPAAVLLERIKVEKERLVKEKKIKVAKALLPIKGDEWPYELPKEWKLARLGELVESMTNGIYKPSKYYSDNGIACLRMYNIQRGKINYLNLKRMLLEDDEIERYRLVSGDLLVNRVNSRELVGKAGVINLFEESLIFESKNIRVRFIICEELPEYINILFQTREVREVFEGDAKQTCGQASISQPQVAGIITPLPPLAEQRRIVAKVDQLMALCDDLESKLKQSQTDGEVLMEVMVAELIGA